MSYRGASYQEFLKEVGQLSFRKKTDSLQYEVPSRTHIYHQLSLYASQNKLVRNGTTYALISPQQVLKVSKGHQDVLKIMKSELPLISFKDVFLKKDMSQDLTDYIVGFYRDYEPGQAPYWYFRRVLQE